MNSFNKKNLEFNEDDNICPISMEQMIEPFTLACGHTFYN